MKPEKLTDNNGKKKMKAAVELGKLGGKEGGPARAKKLPAGKRESIAKKAADTRWGNTPQTKKPSKS